MKRKNLGNRNWIFTISHLMVGMIFFFSCQKQVQQESLSPETVLEEETANGIFPYHRLSTYGFFEGDIKNLKPAADLIFYQPASSLFTDNAFKSRFVYIPEGEKAQLEGDDLSLPLGSVLVKNFFYPADFRNPQDDRRIIETRLMIREENGWQAYPYVWNESQSDAVLKVIGGEFEVSYVDLQGKLQLVSYLVPNKNQCKSCHNKNEIMAPIGFQTKHLNHSLDFVGQSPSNQLEFLTQTGKLEGFKGASKHPSMVNYEDESQALAQRAMAYLDINCAHCHSADGPASTSGLFLTYDQKDPMKLGINKTPVAAGSGAGGFKFDIVPGKPDESILVHRMNSTQAGIAMPELGRTTVDKKGLELIKAWISNLE